MLQKPVFKVISPIEKKDGGTWWLRCGSGYRNKDNSLNLYIEALPTSHKDGPLKLQVRELTDEDLREQTERSQRRSAFAASGTPQGSPSGFSGGEHGPGRASATEIPF